MKLKSNIVFNFQSKDKYFKGTMNWKQKTGWFLARSTRNIAIFASFIFVGYVSAFIDHQFNIKVVQAAPEQVIVPKELTLQDFPILMKICKAESGLKQFLPNGSVVRGHVNHSDIGICQINEAINNDQARKMGYDIFTEKGNVQMAIWMFINQGTNPWNSSKDGTNGWGNK